MEEIVITDVSVNDVDSLLLLARKTYSETFGPYNTKENLETYLGKAFTAEQLLKEMSEANSKWYFILSGNVKAGYLKVNFGNAQTELRDAKAMEIERIYVLQKYQGKRIGKLLLENAIAIAHQHKVDYVWLGVWEHNSKALLFYKKHGFTTFDQHSFFVGDDEQTDWMMKLTLKDSLSSTSDIDMKNE